MKSSGLNFLRHISDPGESADITAIAVNGISAILLFMQHLEFYTNARRKPLGIIPFICCLILAFNICTGQAATLRTVSASGTPPSSLKNVDSYTITQREDTYRVNISYPQVGNPVADAELSIWAREQATAFTDSVKMIPTPPAVPYELFITYETLQASSRVISIVFFISTTTGGVHPEPGLATFVYDRLDGRRLSYGDVFANQDKMPQALSSICRASLTERLGDRVVPDMLEAGTAPEMTNFDLFALDSAGLRVYFPPYQAAPYSEGYLNVTVPLDELTNFKPHLAFWGKP